MRAVCTRWPDEQMEEEEERRRGLPVPGWGPGGARGPPVQTSRWPGSRWWRPPSSRPWPPSRSSTSCLCFVFQNPSSCLRISRESIHTAKARKTNKLRLLENWQPQRITDTAGVFRRHAPGSMAAPAGPGPCLLHYAAGE